jgi:hypothetical protein
LERLAAAALLCLSFGACDAFQGCQGCDGCDERDEPLAVLMATQGPEIARDYAANAGAWTTADPGAEFFLGDGVRTGDGTEAILRLADGNQLRLRERTLVRFLTESTDSEDQRLAVETGAAVLSASEHSMRLVTELGAAIIQSGSRVVLTRDEDRVRYAVELGGARFVPADGSGAVELGAGEQFEVGVGEAVFGPVPQEPEDRPPPIDAGAPTDAGAAPDAGEPDMAFIEDPGVEVDEDGGPIGQPGLSPQSLRVPAGARVMVHAVSGPVTIGIDVGQKCPGGGVIQLNNPRARFHGKGHVGVPVAVGRRAYTVRCIAGGKVQKRVVARGALYLLRDSGTRKLPPRAPTSYVDADGRTYNIFYQNQRPNIVFRWPNAPTSDSYTLQVDSETRTIDSAEHTFRSGRLGDGKHRISLAAAGRRSRPATIVVRFDNAAPKASLSEPDEGGFAVGDTVKVSGVALPGWKVSAEGGTIEMDEAHRFSGEVATSAERPDVALRLTHPRLGVHYYLRRSSRPR